MEDFVWTVAECNAPGGEMTAKNSGSRVFSLNKTVEGKSWYCLHNRVTGLQGHNLGPCRDEDGALVSLKNMFYSNHRKQWIDWMQTTFKRNEIILFVHCIEILKTCDEQACVINTGYNKCDKLSVTNQGWQTKCDKNVCNTKLSDINHSERSTHKCKNYS